MYSAGYLAQGRLLEYVHHVRSFGCIVCMCRWIFVHILHLCRWCVGVLEGESKTVLHTVALKVTPHERSLPRHSSRTFPPQSPFTNVLSQMFPSRTFSRKHFLVNVLFENIPSQMFTRLWRALALPHSSTCGMNKDTQHDKAQQMTTKLHHTVEQSYLTMSSTHAR